MIPSAVAKLNLIESNLQLNVQHFPNSLSITAHKLYAFIQMLEFLCDTVINTQYGENMGVIHKHESKTVFV